MDGKYVFISYKVEDSADANWVKSTLESNGIQCWMAPDSIPGGSSYASEIENAIKDCSAFVLILSEKAQKSKWVSKELDRALNFGKRIMPFTMDNAPLENDFSFYLSNVQRYDATSDKREAMRVMHADIIKELQSPASSIIFKKNPPKAQNQSEKNTLKGKIKRILIVIGILSILSYILAFWIGFSDDSPSDEDISSGVTESNETNNFYEQNQYQTDSFYDSANSSDNSFSITDTGISKENVSFVLDGVAYLLPCSFGDFINNGWEISSTSSYNIMSIIGDEAFLSICKGNKYASLEVHNISGDPLELIYCAVVEIEVWYNDNVDFIGPLGVRIGDTPDDITQTYGTPNYTDIYEDYFTHIFMFNGEKGYISASYENNTYNSYVITLRNEFY